MEYGSLAIGGWVWEVGSHFHVNCPHMLKFTSVDEYNQKKKKGSQMNINLQEVKY